MTPTLQQLFIAHGAILFVAALLFLRALPINLWLCALVVHMSVPAFILVKGNQSAIYLIDLIAPALAVLTLWTARRDNEDAALVTRCLIALLIVVPLVAGAMAYALGNVNEVDRREWKETFLWFFRNGVFLCVFIFASRQRIDSERAGALIKMILVLSSLSAALGMLSYFGPLNLAVFELLSAQKDAEWTELIHSSRIGSGFLGLFRASVGQWFVCVVLLAVASLGVVKHLYRGVAIAAIALGIGVVLLSYSRAGAVGLAVGLLILAVLGGNRTQQVTALMAVAIAVVWFWLQSDLVAARLNSIVSADDDASQGRLYIWGLSLRLFASDISLLLAGTGPASRGRVFELIHGFGAHNEYIDIVYRMGIAGFIMLMVVVMLLARSMWRRRQSMDGATRAFCSGMLAALIANCAMGLTQDHLIHDYAGHAAGAFIYFLYGIALATSARSTAEQAQPASSMAAWQPPNLMGSRVSQECRLFEET